MVLNKNKKAVVIAAAVIFIAACILAFSSGTSWGTFSILIPIVAAIFPTGSELLIIGMSACLAGAVCTVISPFYLACPMGFLALHFYRGER